MNRLGRGYSFEALRAKILFTEGVHKIEKPKFRRPEPAPEHEEYACYSRTFMGSGLTQTDEHQINYGADITTLVKLIEAGQL
jgi:hypothetical protein